jgi:hypothetical protein
LAIVGIETQERPFRQSVMHPDETCTLLAGLPLV